MKSLRWAAVCILGLFCFGIRAYAHHAFAAEFDIKRVLTLEGTVVQMEWINPHAWLTVDVQSPAGETEQWMVEFGPPNMLFRKGFRRDSFQPKMKVTVTGFGATDGRRVLNADTVTLADGRKLKGESNTVKEEGPLGQRLAK
jgi:hypothetical protein